MRSKINIVGAIHESPAHYSKMKTIILLSLVFIVTPRTLFCQDKISLYKSAFQYIISDTGKDIKRTFQTELSEENTFVGTVLVQLKRSTFGREIAKFEYGLTDPKEISEFADSLAYTDDMADTIYFKDYNKINPDYSEKTFKIYFSKVVNNQISAEVIYYDIKYKAKRRNYKETMWSAICWVEYYFYFNDKGKIIKVFTESGCQ